jgi:hypothetical protein
MTLQPSEPPPVGRDAGTGPANVSLTLKNPARTA